MFSQFFHPEWGQEITRAGLLIHFAQCATNVRSSDIVCCSALGLCKFSVSVFCTSDVEVSPLLCVYLIFSVYVKLRSVSLFGGKIFPLSVPRWCQWPAGSGQSMVALWLLWHQLTLFHCICLNVTIVFVSNQHFVFVIIWRQVAARAL